MADLTRMALRLRFILSCVFLAGVQAQPQDKWIHDTPREFQAHHRELQKPASMCATGPSNFATSLYINHVGDGTSFQETDLDVLLQYALLTFNKLAADSCDTTFRTLQAVSVASVFYTDSLDFIRLRYDFTGQCKGCVPGQLDSGIGPLFGNYENIQPTTTAITRRADPGTRRLGRGRRARRSNRRQLQTPVGGAPPPLAPPLSPARHGGKAEGLIGKGGKAGKGGKGLSPVQGTAQAAAETPIQTSPQSTPQATVKVTSSAAPQTSPQPAPQTAVPETPNNGNPPDRQFQLPVSNPNPMCSCSSGTTTPRGPTPTEFANALNIRITEGRTTGALSGVVSVNEVFEAGIAGHSTVVPTTEARDLSCAQSEDFSTDVWVEFLNGQALTESEKIPMEVALQAAFNEMMLLSCDVPYFRMINDVTYMESRAGGSNKVQLKFKVAGKCVNCDPSTMTLFGTNPQESSSPWDPVSVDEFHSPSSTLLLAQIQQVRVLESGSVVVVRNNPVSCTCPLNDAKLNLRAPTRREFTIIFQNTINTLRSQNQITSVQQVIRVTEREMDGQCSADVTTAETVFVADLDGNPELLIESEIARLEEGFAQTYNDFTYNSCDSYHRTITAVQMIPGVSRRRILQAIEERQASQVPQDFGTFFRRALQWTGAGSASNGTDIARMQSQAPSLYLVTGQCRGCPVSSSGSFSLMNDAFRIRNLRIEDVPSFMTAFEVSNGEPPIKVADSRPERRLQECECAPGKYPTDPAAPTVDTFRSAYNAKINEYNAAGLVTNVKSVLQLIIGPPSGVVRVGFSIFYGTLERIGNPTASEYGPLQKETNQFYQIHMTNYYRNSKDVSLLGVNVTIAGPGSVRADLDKLQVPFAAEFMFAQNKKIPTSDDLTVIMAQLDYVEYITDHLWVLDNETSSFGKTHSVRFAGRESKVVDIQLLFSVQPGQKAKTPNKKERSELEAVLDEFFTTHLRNYGFYVTYFQSHIDAEDISITSDDMILINFDATVVFSTVVERPSLEQLQAAMQTADLEDLRAQLTSAQSVGTGLFGQPEGVTYHQGRNL